MKLFKSLAIAAICASSLFGVSSCSTDNTPSIPIYEIDLEGAQFSFNDDNYWTGCYDAAVGDFKVASKAGSFSFSHKAWADEWDGVSYPAWKGFCPSRVDDIKDYANDWVNHQWACAAQGFNGLVYLVGNSESVVSENPLANDKCSITVDGSYINPQYVYVTNSTYAYYAAKNGTAFNAPFKDTDNFVLNIVGVRNGIMTNHLKQPLMTNGQYLTAWMPISLQQLGTVDKILFYIDSTQKNEYGLTVPSYFCLTGFVYTTPDQNESK